MSGAGDVMKRGVHIGKLKEVKGRSWIHAELISKYNNMIEGLSYVLDNPVKKVV
jgi:hypothetical protein